MRHMMQEWLHNAEARATWNGPEVPKAGLEGGLGGCFAGAFPCYTRAPGIADPRPARALELVQTQPMRASTFYVAH